MTSTQSISSNRNIKKIDKKTYKVDIVGSSNLEIGLESIRPHDVFYILTL